MTSSRLSPICLASLLLLAALSHAQSLSVLYNFGSATGDPLNPAYIGAVVQGEDGNLYTTAVNGGLDGADGGDPVCCGSVFMMTPAGTLNTLYEFTGGADGGNPTGGLTLGTDGNFYGTTYRGGSNGFGTIFKITSQGTLTTLYSFTAGTDGAYPSSAPVEGADGSFYGTTQEGGESSCNGGDGCGTIYKITPAGVFTAIFQFDFTNGTDPESLILGTNGNFYGTTGAGGANDLGVIFEVTSAGKFAVLHSFANNEGSFVPLVQGSDGNFYGVSTNGPGTHGSGAVFKMTPSGKFTILHSMNFATDGDQPSGLMQATDGNFYGVNAYGGPANPSCSAGTCGTLFQITLGGDFSVVYNFDYTTGMAPEVAPLQHTSGVLYADTEFGGTGNLGSCSAVTCGVFYSWTNASLPPFISLLPQFGKVGAVIGVLGQGFVPGETVVSFNGTAAKTKIVSSTYLIAKVPTGATTGSVVVTTSASSLTSNKTFQVIP